MNVHVTCLSRLHTRIRILSVLGFRGFLKMSSEKARKEVATSDERDPLREIRFPTGIAGETGLSSTVNLIVAAHSSEHKKRNDPTFVESRTNQVALVSNCGRQTVTGMILPSILPE